MTATAPLGAGSITATGWCLDRLAEAYVRGLHVAYSGPGPRLVPTPDQFAHLNCLGSLWHAAGWPPWPGQHPTVDKLLDALAIHHHLMHIGSTDYEAFWPTVSAAIVAWREAGFPGIAPANTAPQEAP